MIRDPYIGMPINMGGHCDTVSTMPPTQPQPQPPETASQPPAAAAQPPQTANQQSSQSANQQSSQPPAPPQNADQQTLTSAASSQSGNRRQAEENASGFDAMYLGSLPLAMAYVPMQQWKNVYSPQEGLSRGTIFSELDLPFEGRTILSEQNNGRRMR